MLGCELPIEVWHLGEREMSQAMRRLLEEYRVACVDAQAVRRVHPVRRLGGWELKCYALLHSRFAEVLLLDADNCPVRDPAFLFEAAEYRGQGAVFWPDFWRFHGGEPVWAAAGLAPVEAQQFESGQMVLDKGRCWRALHLAMHLNEHSEWWYRLVHGDKDTFQLGWRKAGQPYTLMPHPVRALDGVMLQHDFAGRLLFQHRNFAKWTLDGNRRIPGFRLERECLGFVGELRSQWNPCPPGVRRFAEGGKSPAERAAAWGLTGGRWEYVRVGHDRRAMTFLPDGRVGEGAAGCEVYWEVRTVEGRVQVRGLFAAVPHVHGVAGWARRVARSLGAFRGDAGGVAPAESVGGEKAGENTGGGAGGVKTGQGAIGERGSIVEKMIRQVTERGFDTRKSRRNVRERSGKVDGKVAGTLDG